MTNNNQLPKKFITQTYTEQLKSTLAELEEMLRNYAPILTKSLTEQLEMYPWTHIPKSTSTSAYLADLTTSQYISLMCLAIA